MTKLRIWLLPFFIFLLSKNHISGLRCELKGLVNDKVQCMLHDRGINTNVGKDASLKGQKRTQVELDLWKYSTGLDSNKSFYTGDVLEDFKNRIRDWIPGTRWCGDGGGGATLTSDDLGMFVRTDNCCKNHDSCPMIIKTKDTRFELINDGLFARFHCDCEKAFFNCLKNVNSPTSNKIGFTYFTVVGPQCFRMERPIINCTRKIMARCLEYRYNKTEEKKNQWFDLPLY